MAGAPEEFFDKASGSQEEHFKVWPENWNGLTIFLRCETQWVSDFGKLRGLNYQSVFTVIDAVFPDIEPAQRCGIFTDVQLMESTILEELANEQRH